VTLTESVKENLKLKQEIILELIVERIKLNIIDFFTDVATLLALSFNIVGFWRYSTLHRRYKLKILTRKDMITNPFYSLCDLPWLILCVIVLVLGPWRFVFTFWKLSLKIKHFPDDEVRRVIDYSLVLCSLGLLLRDYIDASSLSCVLDSSIPLESCRVGLSSLA
jgi:hypothetical protein